MTSIGTSGVELGDTLGTSNTIRRVNVVQNTFTGNFQGVILDINSTTSSSQIQDSVIARNVFVGNMGAMGLEAGVDTGTTNNVIANTQIVDNLVSLTGYNGQGAATIQIQDNQSGTNNKVTGVSFVNNTIDNGTSASPSGWGVWVTSSGGVNGVSIENTIFWGNESNPPLKGITSPSQVSYSIIDQSGFSGTNNNINADPLFVNASSGNFELQSGSPALHAGTSVGAPAIDIDCQPRAARPSIGAYEYEGPDICPSTYSAPLPLTATPTAGQVPLAVAFRASGLSPAKSYKVNFGDGSIGPVTREQLLRHAPARRRPEWSPMLRRRLPHLHHGRYLHGDARERVRRQARQHRDGYRGRLKAACRWSRLVEEGSGAIAAGASRKCGRGASYGIQ